MKIFKDFNYEIKNNYTDSYKGIDIIPIDNGNKVNDYVIALNEGVVKEVFFEKDYDNNYITVEQSDGYLIKYGHLSFYEQLKSIKDKVLKGDIIGLIDNEFLHLEIKHKDETINPINYIIDDKPKKIFECEKDGNYYIKLRKNDELYLLRKNL